MYCSKQRHRELGWEGPASRTSSKPDAYSRFVRYGRSHISTSEAHFCSASEGAICVARAGLALVMLSIEGILGITHTTSCRTYELSTSHRARTQDGSQKSTIDLTLPAVHRPAPGPSRAPADTPASTAALTPTMPSGSDVVVSTYSLSTACGPMCGVQNMSESEGEWISEGCRGVRCTQAGQAART